MECTNGNDPAEKGRLLFASLSLLGGCWFWHQQWLWQIGTKRHCQLESPPEESEITADLEFVLMAEGGRVKGKAGMWMKGVQGEMHLLSGRSLVLTISCPDQSIQ